MRGIAVSTALYAIPFRIRKFQKVSMQTDIEGQALVRRRPVQMCLDLRIYIDVDDLRAEDNERQQDREEVNEPTNRRRCS
jgi:hypothetical protein